MVKIENIDEVLIDDCLNLEKSSEKASKTAQIANQIASNNGIKRANSEKIFKVERVDRGLRFGGDLGVESEVR
jgi:hypothetical protein